MYRQKLVSLFFSLLIAFVFTPYAAHAEGDKSKNEMPLPLIYFDYWRAAQSVEATDESFTKFMSLLADDFVFSQQQVGAFPDKEPLTKKGLINALKKRATHFTHYDMDMITFYDSPGMITLLYSTTDISPNVSEKDMNPTKQVFVEIIEVDNGLIASVNRFIEVKSEKNTAN